MSTAGHAIVAPGAFQATVRGPRLWADALCAVAALAIARLTLARADLAAAAAGDPAAPGSADRHAAALIDRIAYVIPRIARRVPWRSDCLIQALAAQQWLKRQGIASTVKLATRRESGAFDAHAWLEAQGTVVTGWDNAQFETYHAFAPPADPQA